LALELGARAHKKDALVGKDPLGMAASILYLVNLTERKKSPLTQADIAGAAAVTEVTIRNRSKELRKKLGIEKFPQSNNLKTG
jgi:transcription initiation factor TFIIB